MPLKTNDRTADSETPWEASERHERKCQAKPLQALAKPTQAFRENKMPCDTSEGIPERKAHDDSESITEQSLATPMQALEQCPCEANASTRKRLVKPTGQTPCEANTSPREAIEGYEKNTTSACVCVRACAYMFVYV